MIIHSLNDVKTAAQNLASFHNHCLDISFSSENLRKYNSISKQYEQKYSELKSIGRYIRKRKNKGIFWISVSGADKRILGTVRRFYKNFKQYHTIEIWVVSWKFTATIILSWHLISLLQFILNGFIMVIRLDDYYFWKKHLRKIIITLRFVKHFL